MLLLGLGKFLFTSIQQFQSQMIQDIKKYIKLWITTAWIYSRLNCEEQ